MPGNEIATSIKMTASNNALKKRHPNDSKEALVLALNHASLNLPETAWALARENYESLTKLRIVGHFL